MPEALCAAFQLIYLCFRLAELQRLANVPQALFDDLAAQQRWIEARVSRAEEISILAEEVALCLTKETNRNGFEGIVAPGYDTVGAGDAVGVCLPHVKRREGRRLGPLPASAPCQKMSTKLGWQTDKTKIKNKNLSLHTLVSLAGSGGPRRCSEHAPDTR